VAEPEQVGLGALALGLLIDGTLVAEAIALRLAPVSDFLETHEGLLLWTLGPLHALILPLMFLLPIARTCPASRLLFDESGGSAEAKLFPWLVVLSLCAGFMVPLLGLTSREFPGAWWMIAVTIGPMLGVFLGGWLLVKFEDKSQLVPPPLSPAERGWLTLVTWLYLAELEAVLFVGARSDGVMADFVVPALLVAYLPIRLFLYYSRSTRPWELASVFAALLITMGQLLAAG